MGNHKESTHQALTLHNHFCTETDSGGGSVFLGFLSIHTYTAQRTSGAFHVVSTTWHLALLSVYPGAHRGREMAPLVIFTLQDSSRKGKRRMRLHKGIRVLSESAAASSRLPSAYAGFCRNVLSLLMSVRRLNSLVCSNFHALLF